VLDINGRKKEWQNDDEPRTKYALETDWLAEAGGFEPAHLELKGAPDRRLDPVKAG
jgi:hypothetical protein